MGIALGLAAVGLFLSAFFSGSETGFYRATRIRLVLDARAGDLIARGLLWLTNHPSLFIATTLVGNNTANYLLSLAIVMGTQSLVSGDGHLAELLAPLVLAPLVFVYGELLPKNLFLHAPNRLLRKGGPLFFVFVPLFLPVSALLWGLNRVLARLVAESPEKVRLAVARRELRRALEEGHEVGLLRPAQRELARGIFAEAKEPVTRYVTPLADVARAKPGMGKEEIRRLARQHRAPVVLLEDPEAVPPLVGYVRLIDLELDPSEAVGRGRPLMTVSDRVTHLEALVQLHAEGEDLAQVVDAEGRLLGVLTARRLREPLFRPVT